MSKRIVVGFSLIILLTISFAAWEFTSPSQNEEPTRTERILTKFFSKTVPPGSDSLYNIDSTFAAQIG